MIERTLDSASSSKDTRKVRATFERILKSAGIEPPASVVNARDLARETYTATKIAAIIA
jgi:hypothetical protein